MSKNLKVLFVSKELIAADLAYRLKREGCNVKLFIENEEDKDCFDGLVDKTNDWRKELDWVKKDGLIVFDDVGYGEMQDYLRREGYLVVGGSGDGDKLELDREYGQEILKACGVKISSNFETKIFTIDSAIAFIDKCKGRWVLKKDDHDESFTYIGNRDDGSDVVSLLGNYRNRFGGPHLCSIQKRVTGIEIAVGRFFNGKDWVGPLVFNVEHKNVCNDDVGPLGGETGTLMWYEKDENKRLFQETLAKLKVQLRRSTYRGYIDINCIVTRDTVYPLEITSRFGSSTNEVQSEIQKSHWSDILVAIAKGDEYRLDYEKGYGIGVALTVSPFPYRTTDKNLSQKGLNIFFDSDLSDADWMHLHYEEVSVKRDAVDRYYISGSTGYVLYVTGCGNTVHTARTKVYALIDKIIVPKMFYRTDIGLRFVKEDRKKLTEWGWI